MRLVKPVSQYKQYYQDKISENRDWVMVGIYADEAITGTKVDNIEMKAV